MPQSYFEMEESRSVTPWVNRLYFESPRASSFLGLRLVKARHENLVPLFSGVKPDPMVGSGRYAESIPVKSPMRSVTDRPNHRGRDGTYRPTTNSPIFPPMALLFLMLDSGPLGILSKNKEYKLHFPLVKCLEISSNGIFVYNLWFKPVWYTYCVKFTTALVNVFSMC